MTRLLQDFRYAARTLARGRMVTGLAVVAFALGIGVTTAVFSIFDSVLLRPLPYPDAHELVLVYDTQPACNTCPASFPKYHDWKTRNEVFDAIGGSTPGSFTLTGAGDPVRVRGIPTLMLFKNGQVAATKIGALPKNALYQWVQSVI